MKNDPYALEGKCCVVTGASSGLGLHMAGVLAAQGAHVFGLSLELPNEESCVDEVTHLIGDVSDTDAMETAITQIEGRAGPIECWVNNAGIGGYGRKGGLQSKEFERLLAVNAVAPGVLGDLVAGRMKANGVAGSVINVSSALGRTAMPSAAAYGASKAALDHLTRQQARAWALHGIRFNAIAPGWFRTAMTQEVFDKGFDAVLKGQIPMRRLGTADDLDGALILLASSASEYITGTIISIDGGFSC